MIEKVVVLLSTEQLVITQLTATITAHGGRVIVVTTGADFVATVDREFPVLGVIDMTTATDWATAVAQCKLRPHTRMMPICAFSRTDEQPLRREAEKVGVDQIWPWDAVAAGHEALIRAQLAPAISYPSGWDDALSAQAWAGVAAFNRGDYFEQHEHFEAAWIAEERPIRTMYQGILQIGLAFLQMEEGNWRGAIKMFRRGLPKLRPLPATCQGIAIAELRSAAEAIHNELIQLGPEGLQRFNRRRFPRIHVDDERADKLGTLPVKCE